MSDVVAQQKGSVRQTVTKDDSLLLTAYMFDQEQLFKIASAKVLEGARIVEFGYTEADKEGTWGKMWCRLETPTGAHQLTLI